MRALADRIVNACSQLTALVARHWRNRFYLYLAAVFSVFVVADAIVFHFAAQMRQSTFDAMVRYRFVVPHPDPDITIVDINDASLAAMSQQYGRWPWPRQVLGEFLENLERQHPRAVVFDILFSDPDIYNPDSDAYFDAAIAITNNTYFPFLRLDGTSDVLSRIRPGMIPGVRPISGDAQPDATVAVILPHFASALSGARLGFNNIYPDPDGTVREYRLQRNDYGWQLPSLPLRIAQLLGWKLPKDESVLLNWRGPAFSYRYVAFSDVFDDMSSRVKRRPQNEFTGRIVLIGSTAPGLFDVKQTPVGRLYPGVEILATAIDNLKHQDYLHFPQGRSLYPLLTLAIVWATACSFFRHSGRDRIDRLFGASQFILVAISYASVNLSNTYINLTGPIAVAIAFFTTARIYAAATDRALEQSALRYAAEHVGQLRGGLLLIRLVGLGARPAEKIRRRLEHTGSEPKSVELLQGKQKGIWSLLENTLAVTWVLPAQDGAARISHDAKAVTGALSRLLSRYPGARASFELRDGAMSGGLRAPDEWRALLTVALSGSAEQSSATGVHAVESTSETGPSGASRARTV